MRSKVLPQLDRRFFKCVIQLIDDVADFFVKADPVNKVADKGFSCFGNKVCFKQFLKILIYLANEKTVAE